MLMDGKTQCYSDVHSPPIALRFNAFPAKLPEGILWKFQAHSEMYRKMLRT